MYVWCFDFNYNKLHRIVPLIMGISYLALIIVLIVPSGEAGVHRWIPLGPFNIQPSEIAKFSTILFFAHWCSKHYDKMQLPKFSVLPGITVFGTTAMLLSLSLTTRVSLLLQCLPSLCFTLAV